MFVLFVWTKWNKYSGNHNLLEIACSMICVTWNCTVWFGIISEFAFNAGLTFAIYFFCCMHEIVAFFKFGMYKLTKLSIRHFWEMIGFHVTFRVVCCFMSLKYLIFNFLNQKRTNRFWGELVKTVQMFGRADHSSKISPAFLFTFLSTVPSTFSWPLKFTVL